MTPSEKEKIIKDSYDAIKDLYILRNELLTDAGNLEAARESNRKLSDRVANLEVTIKALNSAIDKKDVEIKSLREKYDLLNRAHVKLCGDYDKLHKAMIAEVMGYATHDAEEDIKKLKEDLESQQKARVKLCEKYNALLEKTAVLEDKIHDFREKFSKLYLLYIHEMLDAKDMTAFVHWFNDTFGDFGNNDEEE